MNDVEGRLVSRSSAVKLLIAGAVVAGTGYLPLQLYVSFGPRDGNPIGLGLLTIVAVPVGLAVVAMGVIKLAVEYVSKRKG